MKTDIYTKIMLGLITLCLLTLTIQNSLLLDQANASIPASNETIKVNVVDWDVTDEVEVTVNRWEVSEEIDVNIDEVGGRYIHGGIIKTEEQ